MLLRKLLAALGPPLLCAATCALYRWMDTWLAAGYFSFLLKGLLLGACLALIPPVAGARTRLTGLSGWLLAGAGLLAAVLIYQYLESTGAVRWPAVLAVVGLGGQSVLAESAALGFAVTACATYRGR